MKILLVGGGAGFSTKDVEMGYLRALRRAGHTVIHYKLDGRIDHAARFLDSSWKREAKKRERPTAADVLYLAASGILEKAFRFEVDWVFVVSSMYLHPDWLILLKRAGLRTSVLLTESPYDDELQGAVLKYVDLAWTNERSSVPYLKQFHPHVSYLPHAYDPEKHHPDIAVEDDVPAHDVVFVGTGFAERIELLSAVDWTGIDLGLYGTWQLLPSRHKLRQYVRNGPVGNDFAAKLYRKAKIGLNLYRTSKGFGKATPRIEHAESLNPRALELAAIGCYQVSDWRQEVAEVFKESVATFQAPEQLEAAIRFALASPLHRDVQPALAMRAVQGRTFDAMANAVVAGMEWRAEQMKPAVIEVAYSPNVNLTSTSHRFRVVEEVKG